MFRAVVPITMLAHGVGYSLWLLQAWIPGIRVGPVEHWVFSDRVLIASPLGKAFGLLALAVMIGFAAAAWGLSTRAAWWESVVTASVIGGLIMLVPWWTVVALGSAIGALTLNAAVLLVLLVPGLRDMMNRAVPV